MSSKQETPTIKTATHANPFNIARLVRVARKRSGLTQEVISRELGLNQSAFSRIEQGNQNMTATQWFVFCQITGILPESAQWGFVESLKKVTAGTGRREGGFTLPQQYAVSRGMTVRSLLPLIEYYRQEIGMYEFEQLVESKKIKSDFFLDLDNRVNFSFFLDLLGEIKTKKSFSSKKFESMLKKTDSSHFHGGMHSCYQFAETSFEALKVHISKTPYYECDFLYKIEKEKASELSLRMTPSDYLKSLGFHKNEELVDSFLEYKSSYLKSFSIYGEKTQPLGVTPEEAKRSGEILIRVSA